MNHAFTINQEETLYEFSLTASQEIVATTLVPETRAYMQSLLTSHIKQIAELRFTGSPEEIEATVQEHIYLQGRKDMLISLLDAASNLSHTNPQE